MVIKVITQRQVLIISKNPGTKKIVMRQDLYAHAMRNKKKNLLKFQQVCGERGIRTPGTSRYGSFQDYCNRPLYHLSRALIS